VGHHSHSNANELHMIHRSRDIKDSKHLFSHQTQKWVRKTKKNETRMDCKNIKKIGITNLAHLKQVYNKKTYWWSSITKHGQKNIKVCFVGCNKEFKLVTFTQNRHKKKKKIE